MSRRKREKINNVEVSDLLGKTIIDVETSKTDEDLVKDNVLTFITEEGEMYKFIHNQACCESVYIEDITGNLDNLVGSPLAVAEVVTNSTDDKDDEFNTIEAGPDPDENYLSYTWTYYKFATIKGYVTIRWFGESNGFYSEEVDIVKEDLMF